MTKRYEGRKLLRPTVLRGIVAGVVALAIVISCISHVGWGTLSAFGVGDWYLLCPLGGLEAMLASHSIIASALVSLAIVFVLVLVFGKAFCAWACPVSVLSRFLSGKKKRTAQKEDRQESADQVLVRFKELHVAQGCASCAGCAQGASAERASSTAGYRQVDDRQSPSMTQDASCSDAPGGPSSPRRKLSLDGRHVVLGGALVSALVFGFPVFCLICPIGLTFGTVVSLVRLVGFNEPSWGLLLFPAIIVVELVVLRRWCHTLCPVSALMSLIASFNRTLRPKANESLCLRTAGEPCAVCASVCPEHLDPRSDLGIRTLSECTRCGACVEACPKGALSFTKRGLARGGDACASGNETELPTELDPAPASTAD